MRTKLHDSLDAMRITDGRFKSLTGSLHGAFQCWRNGHYLRFISSGTTEDWEHVSVSTQHSCPTWEEMCFVKDLFWSGSETVIQFHPKLSAYNNVHPFCLHLWKRSGVDMELPPRESV